MNSLSHDIVIIFSSLQLHDECSHFPPLPVVEDSSPLGLLLEERKLQAELAVWKRQLPSGELYSTGSLSQLHNGGSTPRKPLVNNCTNLVTPL